MTKNKRSNIEVLRIIVASWNLHMVDANTTCAKSDLKINENIINLISFITGGELTANDIYLSKNEYVNNAIDHYNNFKSISEGIKYTRWKSTKNNPLIKTFGAHFDIYYSNGFNTDFLKYTPFLKLSKRQFARIFIKIKNDVIR